MDSHGSIVGIFKNFLLHSLEIGRLVDSFLFDARFPINRSRGKITQVLITLLCSQNPILFTERPSGKWEQEKPRPRASASKSPPLSKTLRSESKLQSPLLSSRIRFPRKQHPSRNGHRSAYFGEDRRGCHVWPFVKRDFLFLNNSCRSWQHCSLRSMVPYGGWW